VEQPNAMADSEHHRNQRADRRAERRFHADPKKKLASATDAAVTQKFTEVLRWFHFLISNFCCGVNAVFF